MSIQSKKYHRLFAPRSIVIIGGGAWGENIIRECQNFGYTGSISVVHPTRTSVAGITTVRSLQDIPETPDAAFIGVNRHKTLEAVQQLAAMDCGGAVCFASGFAEVDDTELQQQLVAAAGNMPILGPNCYGFINGLERCILWPDHHGIQPMQRGVAILAQSSNIAINLSQQQRGLPIAMMATLGNQAQTSLCDLAEWLLEDDRITALGLYIEGIDDLARWCALAKKAHDLNKPIVALKVGKSAQAQAAAISHTASLAGSAAGGSALLQRYGIAEVADLPTLLEALKIAHVHGWLEGKRLASMSCSGGEASLIADIALEAGIEFPPLPEAVDAALHAALGDAVTRTNPLDYHTYIWGDEPAMTRAFRAMFQGDWSLVLLIIDFPRAEDSAAWHQAIAAFDAARQTAETPAAILASLPENLPETIACELIQCGIIPLVDFASALRAIKAMQRPQPYCTPPAQGRRNVTIRTLHEAQAKRYLERLGIPIPTGHSVATHAELYHCSTVMTFPQVLKAQGIAHKTEAGAVVLGLQSPEMVLDAAEKMNAETFLLEEMVQGGVCELLVGVINDPAHGYILTLGAGGQDTELLQDTVSLSLPATQDAIRRALSGLRIAPKLSGYRSQSCIDMSALLRCLDALQQGIVQANGAIEECEINPLICSPNGVWAADALIRIQQ